MNVVVADINEPLVLEEKANMKVNIFFNVFN